MSTEKCKIQCGCIIFIVITSYNNAYNPPWCRNKYCGYILTEVNNKPDLSVPCLSCNLVWVPDTVIFNNTLRFVKYSLGWTFYSPFSENSTYNSFIGTNSEDEMGYRNNL